MTMTRKLLTGSIAVASAVILWSAPAAGSHDHFVRTPGGCHQVAAGSTERHHQFHEHVHEPVGKHGGPLDPANPDGPPVGLSTSPC